MSVREAVAALGMTEAAVVKAVQRKRLPAEKIGRMWFIRLEDIERFKAQPRLRGRPPKPRPA